jgi:hypothetical protein
MQGCSFVFCDVHPLCRYLKGDDAAEIETSTRVAVRDERRPGKSKASDFADYKHDHCQQTTAECTHSYSPTTASARPT